jgi:hypothetical protein
VYDRDIKYGGGEEWIQLVLMDASERVAKLEEDMTQIGVSEQKLASLRQQDKDCHYSKDWEELQKGITELQVLMARSKENLIEAFSVAISKLAKQKGQKQ